MIRDHLTHQTCDDHGCFECHPDLAKIDCTLPECDPCAWRGYITRAEEDDEPFRVNYWYIAPAVAMYFRSGSEIACWKTSATSRVTTTRTLSP